MMLKPAAVANPKDIDWEGGWKTYGELFSGKVAEVRSPPPSPIHASPPQTVMSTIAVMTAVSSRVSCLHS